MIIVSNLKRQSLCSSSEPALIVQKSIVIEGVGRIPLSFRMSASVHADEVLCVYGRPVLWRTTCAEVQWFTPNVD